MITDSYDIASEAVISPRDAYGAQGQLCDVCVLTFSKVIMEHVLEAFSCRRLAHIAACNGGTTVYGLEHGGRTVGIYLSPIGSALAATDVIEANWLTGAERFVMFGSAGSLDRHVTEGRYVVPTRAYRDEGMSYHYAPPADYIEIPNAGRVAALFDELGVPYVTGGSWTTDAFYRETRAQLRKRVSEGCIAVEMELAGVQAVCDFHGWALYDFLQTGDVLGPTSYSYAGLSEANHSLDKLYIALELAARIP